jgi:hypothetical protein
MGALALAAVAAAIAVSSPYLGKTLRQSELVASMGSRGDAYENAACESDDRGGVDEASTGKPRI